MNSMFAKVLRTQTSQPQQSTDQAQPPSSPSKLKSSMATRTGAQPQPSPSKIPLPVTPSHRSSRNAVEPPSPTRESAAAQKENYLAFLQQHQAAQPRAAPAPPKEPYGAAPTRSSVQPTTARAEQPLPPLPSADSDIHMQTVKTVNPAFLRQLATPQSHYQAARAPVQPPVEDIRMQTARFETRQPQQQQPGQMQLWEREILDKADTKRKATVAQLYFLDYYFDLLGYLNNRKKRLEGFKADTQARQVSGEALQKEQQSYNGRERVLLRKRRTKLRVDQFRIIAQVGQGGYGSVYLARKVDTNEVCALKKMRKGTLAKMDEVKHVLVERDILTATKTPWLVRLLYAFQDREHVYLAMEYVPGGDFRTLLNNSGVLKEEHARFYAAEMFAGVNELHKLGYIHRDLKPENFLVDGTGHVKLTDFGLATGALNPLKIESMKNKLDQVKDENLVFRSTLERRTMYRSMRMAEPRYADSVVGSPDYMPPEVLRGRTYTYSADYWSLGCILFEFLCGFPPFSGSTPEETWANLKNWHKVLRRPVYDRPEDLIFNLTDTAWDAVTRLIAHPKDRTASLSDVQALPFFQSLPFGSLRQIAAPFVPVLDGEMDVGYFDSFESAEDMAKYAEVFKKQRDVEAVEERGAGARNNWVGFTFGRNANIVPPARTGPVKAEGEALQTMF